MRQCFFAQCLISEPAEEQRILVITGALQKQVGHSNQFYGPIRFKAGKPELEIRIFEMGVCLDTRLQVRYGFIQFLNAETSNSPLKKYKFSEARKKKDWLWYRLVRKIKETSRKQRRRAVKEAGAKREESQQEEMWVPTSTLSEGPGHPFYTRLNRLLAEGGFDAYVEGLCAPYYAETLGRPSIAPGVYFMLMIGYFEGLGSERGIAWRVADSLCLRRFLGYPLSESPPDHSSLSHKGAPAWRCTKWSSTGC